MGNARFFQSKKFLRSSLMLVTWFSNWFNGGVLNGADPVVMTELPVELTLAISWLWYQVLISGWGQMWEEFCSIFLNMNYIRNADFYINLRPRMAQNKRIMNDKIIWTGVPIHTKQNNSLMISFSGLLKEASGSLMNGLVTELWSLV